MGIQDEELLQEVELELLETVLNSCVLIQCERIE